MSNRVLHAAVVALVVAACSTGPTSTASPSATDEVVVPDPSGFDPEATEPPSTTIVGSGFEILPTDPIPGYVVPVACSGEIGATDPVAIVQLEPTGEDPGEIVLRDFAGSTDEQTVCTFPRDASRFSFSVRLIDAKHLLLDLSTEDRPALFLIVDLPDVTVHWFQLPETSGWGSELITVGPKLDRIVWKAVQPLGSETDEIHVTTAAGDTVVATLPDRNEGRCGEPWDSRQGAYTRSGSELYVLNQPAAAYNSLVVFDGDKKSLSILAPATDWQQGEWPAMAVWSPTTPTLYFTQSGDVWRWTRADGKQRFLRGVSWYRPTISADGRYLAYEAGRADGGTDVYLVDLSSDGDPVKVGADGGNPVFLDDTQLWYARNGVSGGCEGYAEPTFFVRDVGTGTEAPTNLIGVLAVWPATSSNR